MMSQVSELSVLRERLVGRPIHGGEVTVPPHERVIGHRALGFAAADDAILHPAWVTLLGLRGMDLSFEELFALAEATAEAGIYFGEAGIELNQDLEAGKTYKVDGRITDIVRRRGRTIGTFDVLTFELYLRSSDGTCLATANNSFIFARKDPS